MHVGIILQRFNGISLEKIGNWALSTADNFLDHPTARRDLVAFVNLFGNIDSDDTEFRPPSAQDLSRSLGIEEDIESFGERVEAGSHDNHFGDQGYDVGRE